MEQIPKILHYCWFGENPLPPKIRKYMESWEKFCPDYEIVEWNESNYNVYKNQFIAEAYKQKKYAFVSDYARLDIVYQNGGIYLDTDVEIIKPLDDLLDYNCFMGNEDSGRVATGLMFGAKQFSEIIFENLKEYDKAEFSLQRLDDLVCINFTNRSLKKIGWKPNNEIQKLKGVTIFPTDYFCPINPYKKRKNITINSYSIHHYDASWMISPIDKFKRWKNILMLKFKR